MTHCIRGAAGRAVSANTGLAVKRPDYFDLGEPR